MNRIEINDCNKNFSLAFKPVFFLFEMLKKSSKNPIAKKPKLQRNNNNIPIESNLLLITISSNKKGKIINKPPMVGVFFLAEWIDGPSFLIFCNKLNFLITFKPYFVTQKDTKKNVRKIIDINKLLKTKEFTINENKIKKNN